MEEKRYPSHTLDKFQLRFPDGMRDRIKQAAEDSGRSMNAEIIHRLEQSLTDGTPGTHDELPTAEEAKKRSAHSRIVLHKAVRKFFIEEITEAIERGSSSLSVDIEEYLGGDDTNDDLTDPFSNEVLHPVLRELEGAGYRVEHTDGLNFYIEF